MSQAIYDIRKRRYSKGPVVEQVGRGESRGSAQSSSESEPGYRSKAVDLGGCWKAWCTRVA